MATCQDMLDDLNDRLNDVANTQVPQATKIRYLNHGIRATWPKLYRTVRDATLVLLADTYEYNIPSTVGNNSKILRVEVETTASSNRYAPLFDYEVVPGLTDPILVLEGIELVSAVGSALRITAAKPLTQFIATSDTYDGPVNSEELPVLYAMGLALTRRLDDRIDHRRYSTTAAGNAIGPDEIMTAGQFNFAQFELLLDRLAMPLPAQQG